MPKLYSKSIIWTWWKTFSLWSSNSFHWTILSFIRILWLCIYWFFSWKSKVSLSNSIVKCLFIKTRIVEYLGNKDIICLFCISISYTPNIAISFSVAYKHKFAQESSTLGNLLTLWPDLCITLLLLFFSVKFFDRVVCVHCLPSGTTQSLLNPLKFTLSKSINGYVLLKCINRSYATSITEKYTNCCTT